MTDLEQSIRHHNVKGNSTFDKKQEDWGRFMAHIMRHVGTTPHQRPDGNSVRHREVLPNLQSADECPTCHQPLNERKEDLIGLRFDPSDEELLRHLATQVGVDGLVPHPMLEKYISHLDGDEGICQTHPEKLPGVTTDGCSRHFFHKPTKAYTTGNRKRRKIHTEDETGVETRWHKTGKTRPVTEGEKTLGWKKIMVLYSNTYTGKKKAKSEKTNWILHQYHLGPGEEERDGELVVCKVFYQKQPRQCNGAKSAEPGAVVGAAEGETSGRESAQAHSDRIMSITSAGNASPRALITPVKGAPRRPYVTRRGTPELTSLAEPFSVRTPPESGRGSETTVLGAPSNPVAELACSPEVPSWQAQGLINGSSLKFKVIQTQPVPVSWWPEDVNTSEYDVGQGQEHLFVKDEVGDGGLPEPHGLLCTENPDVLLFNDWGAQSMEEDGPVDSTHAFGDIFNPYPEYQFLEELSSSPPAILSDLQFSSQEVDLYWNLKMADELTGSMQATELANGGPAENSDSSCSS